MCILWRTRSAHGKKVSKNVRREVQRRMTFRRPPQGLQQSNNTEDYHLPQTNYHQQVIIIPNDPNGPPSPGYQPNPPPGYQSPGYQSRPPPPPGYQTHPPNQQEGHTVIQVPDNIYEPEPEYAPPPYPGNN